MAGARVVSRLPGEHHWWMRFDSRSVPARSRRVRILGGFAAVALIGIFWAPPAGAHTSLAGTVPAPGVTVDEPVSTITLTFTKAVESLEEEFTLFDADGDPVTIRSVDQPTPEEATVHPAAPLQGSEFGLSWAVRAGDGHVIADSLTFSVSTAAAPSASSAPATEESSESGAQSSELDAALDEAAGSTTTAKALGWAARFVVYAGVLFAVGGLVYLVFVHEGTTAEARRIVFWIRRAAVVIVLATVVQAVSMIGETHDGAIGAAVPFRNWGHTFGGQAGLGMLLAVGGALAILFGLRMSLDTTIRAVPLEASTGRRPAAPPRASTEFWHDEAAFGVSVGTGDDGRATVPTVRTELTRVRVADSRVALAGAGCVVGAFLFLGHTASEGPWLITALADAIHVGATATWTAGAALLAATLWRRRGQSDAPPGAVLVAQFARVAMIAILAALATGLVLAVVILPGPSALWATGFGRLLVLKLALVGVVAALGAHNHYRTVPALRADPFDPVALTQLRRSVTAEAGCFVAVIGLTAALVASSPT